MTPVFGALGLPTHSVSPSNVLLGAGLGIIGAAGFRYAWKKWGALIPVIGTNPMVDKVADVVGAVAVGVGAYFLGKKSEKFYGLAIGAAAAGLAITGTKFGVDYASSFFAGLSPLRLGGLVVPSAGYRGLVVPSRPNVQAAAYRAVSARRR
jgi:hypothetical protein